MSEEEQEKKSFRIVDKRRFNSEGETRPGAVDRPEPVAAPIAQAPRQAPPSPQQPQAAQRADARAPQQEAPQQSQPRTSSGMDFISFIASLATQALASMGALPEARAQGMPVSIEMAREYIEIIAMLHEKTRGNLTREEEQGMQRVMSELRMVYVDVTQRTPGAKPPQPKR